MGDIKMTTNTPIDFQTAFFKMLSENIILSHETMEEYLKQYPVAKVYALDWKDIIETLPPVHQLIVKTVLKGMEPSVPKPIKIKQKKLEIHQKELSMGTFNVHNIATNNSSLMVLLVENPEEALSNLRSGIYTLEEINYPNSLRWTPLRYVARNARDIKGSFELVQVLLELGAFVNAEATGKVSILTSSGYETNRHSTQEVFDLLLNHPTILVNAQSTIHRKTTLMEVIMSSGSDSKLSTVISLLEHPDIDPNIKAEDGEDALLKGLRHFGRESNPGEYCTSKDALVALIKSPKYKLNLQDKMPWFTKYSEADKKNYLQIVFDLYKEHNPTGIYN